LVLFFLFIHILNWVIIVEQIMYYLFQDNMNKELALELYKDSITKDDRFINLIDESYLTIEDKYIGYYTFDACINNHPYYFKNKLTNEAYDGQIDICHIQTDKDLILNELVKNKATPIEEPSYDIINTKAFDEAYKRFISTLKLRALEMITKKHNIKPSRSYYIDIGLLEGFSDMKKEIYYERVYVFRYKNEQRKSDYISILSCYNEKFYSLEFPNSFEYIEYLKFFKKPIEYIPSDFIDFYYQDSFEVYKSTKKKLVFEDASVVLKKIKKSTNYESYSMYSEYLKSGIYYFKIKRYLKKLSVDAESLKRRIYLAYLTLRFQADSGLFLYDCATMGLLDKKGNEMKIKFLEFSYKLGNMRAKKILFEHFSMPINYNLNQIRRYS